MNILERRRDSLLTQFYCALEDTDQHDLVQLIRYKGLTLTYCHWRFISLFSHFSELLLFMIFWSLFILLNAHNIISQPVSFFPHDAMSVCHKPVLYRNGWMDQADFWHCSGYSWLKLHCVVREFGYLQNRGHFSLELCPKLWTQKNIQISPWHMDLRKCCHYLVHTEHPPSCITR